MWLAQGTDKPGAGWGSGIRDQGAVCWEIPHLAAQRGQQLCFCFPQEKLKSRLGFRGWFFCLFD